MTKKRNITDKQNSSLQDRKNASYEKQIFDLKQLLEISKSLSSILDYATLIEAILYTCIGQMKVLGAGIFTKQNFDSSYFNLNRNYTGFELDKNYEYIIHEDSPFVKLLNETDTCLTLDEVEKALGSLEGLEEISSLQPSLIIPLKARTHVNGILILGERLDVGEELAFCEYEKEHILNIASLAAIAVSNSALLEMTTTDMMTHLKLKHYFYSVLIGRLEDSNRFKAPLSIMMLDIDFFKKFNDTYGHACGDVVLQRVAALVEDGVRNQDLAARYGGEEFVVMLHDANAAEAMGIAERIRTAIETMDIVYDGQHLTLTISIGIAEYNPFTKPNAKALVDRADQALYESKRNGRNRVTVAPPDISLEPSAEAAVAGSE
ncbi:MAG: GGDEF domain-containing protein [Spirochaetaceae bacterium]|jgi:diguanylate cyclase (GGDEF)-like protein|nr:GGDEF domain-containing protein [Spirochaetaceae bacterium]